MKIIARISLLLSLFLISVVAKAQAPDEEAADQTTSVETLSGEALAAKADSAYVADDFRLAENLYLEAIASDGVSPIIYYNLGNTYFRQGNFGKSVLYYERSLKLDPTFKDARTNLEFVKSKLTDRQTEQSSLVGKVSDRMINAFTANQWSTIGVIFFALFIAGFLGYMFSEKITLRKVGFFGGILMFIVSVVSIIFAMISASNQTSHDDAIVMQPSTRLSTSPREPRTASEEALLLHEGSKVEIVDSVATDSDGRWYEVIVPTGDRAWIKGADIERI